MDCKAKKYLHIYDWNYWWGYYRCCKDWEPFHAAEFSLSEDEAGKAPFFHFDFHKVKYNKPEELSSVVNKAFAPKKGATPNKTRNG